MVVLVDPRLPDEDVATLSDEYKTMLSEQGGTVISEESWGKRRLAYTIENFNEARYLVYRIDAHESDSRRHVSAKHR